MKFDKSAMKTSHSIAQLIQGEVYEDAYGNTVMVSDEGAVICLSTGAVFVLKRDYSGSDMFTHFPDATLVLK